MGVRPAGDFLAGTMVEVLEPVKDKVKRLVDDLATGAKDDKPTTIDPPPEAPPKEGRPVSVGGTGGAGVQRSEGRAQ